MRWPASLLKDALPALTMRLKSKLPQIKRPKSFVPVKIPCPAEIVEDFEVSSRFAEVVTAIQTI